MDDTQRADYFRVKGYLAHLQSAAMDLEARVAPDIEMRYLAGGVNAAERHANGRRR